MGKAGEWGVQDLHSAYVNTQVREEFHLTSGQSWQFWLRTAWEGQASSPAWEGQDCFITYYLRWPDWPWVEWPQSMLSVDSMKVLTLHMASKCHTSRKREGYLITTNEDENLQMDTTGRSIITQQRWKPQLPTQPSLVPPSQRLSNFVRTLVGWKSQIPTWILLAKVEVEPCFFLWCLAGVEQSIVFLKVFY